MKTRILIFGGSDMQGNLYSLYLRSKGYEVLHFTSPLTCTLMSRTDCTCSRNQVCADIILAEMEMEGMTGIELIRRQKERGCHAPPRNKAILSTRFTDRQEQELRDLGCRSLKKPFRLIDLIAWVNECELNIPPNRKLVPREELLVTPGMQSDSPLCYTGEKTGNGSAGADLHR